MNDVLLINRLLRDHTAETEWLEFKRNSVEPKQIGEYLSALANAACIHRRQAGYLVFGIDDTTHDVVGTDFDPYKKKGKGNQDLLPWLRTMLRPDTEFTARNVAHPDGRVVVFEIAPAKGQPVSFSGKPYIRIGASKTDLDEYPEKARVIWTGNRDWAANDWSAEVCAHAGLGDLDPEALQKAREQFVVKHRVQAHEVREWDDVTLLNKAKVLKQGAVTNAALLLLGRPETSTLLAPKVASIFWGLKDAENRELDYAHVEPPFLLAGDRLLRRVHNLTVRPLPNRTLFPQEILQYDPWVVREALHNSIAHQDYGLRGRITVVEFPDRILLTNVGDFLPGDVETVIRQDAPQAIYRNPFLVGAMVELNLIDTQGGGIKRMFHTQRQRFFPLPDYDLTQGKRVAVGIHGRILDEHYTRTLMERTDLPLEQVMLLDQVQKGRRISKEAHRRLKADGLVEGRYPNLLVAGPVARMTGDAGRHIRERGFDKHYYMDMIHALVREHGPVSRKEIDQALRPKLPDRLTDEQKRTRIHNILQEMRRSGLISNQGSRARPIWTLGEVPPEMAAFVRRGGDPTRRRGKGFFYK